MQSFNIQCRSSLGRQKGTPYMSAIAARVTNSWHNNLSIDEQSQEGCWAAAACVTAPAQGVTHLHEAPVCQPCIHN
jgi:hypothetical protein